MFVFGTAFGLMAMRQAPYFDEQLLITYTTMFGEFEDEYATREEKLFFLMITIVGPLVLLNLLIAIITDLQDHAQSQNHIADIKEKLSFIEEIGKVFWFIKPTESGYIHSCSTKFLDGKQKGGDRWLGKVRELEICI